VRPGVGGEAGGEVGEVSETVSIKRELSIGHRERVALAKLGNPGDSFHFYALEVIGPDAVTLTGCVVTKLRQKGKHKGRPAYDGAPVKVAVTDSEVNAERRRYEGFSGNCAECLGTGQEWAGGSAGVGNRYRPCRTCGGSGKPATQPLPARDEESR
jgi:hypothetical protein